MALGAALFLVRTPRSQESWPRSSLQAIHGSMNFTWQDSGSKPINTTKGWKQNEELPQPGELPSLLFIRQHLASSFSTASHLQEESRTASPSADGTFQKLEKYILFLHCS